MQDAQLQSLLPATDQPKGLGFDSSYEISLNQLTVTDVILGSGAYGMVRLGRLKLDDGETLDVAVKFALSMASLCDWA